MFLNLRFRRALSHTLCCKRISTSIEIRFFGSIHHNFSVAGLIYGSVRRPKIGINSVQTRLGLRSVYIPASIIHPTKIINLT